MLNLKTITRFSLVALILAMALTSPLKSFAQDDSDDEETIVPPTSTSGTQQPTIIDESDSNSVSGVEEYDG